MGDELDNPLDPEYTARLRKIAEHLGRTPDELATAVLECFADKQVQGVKELVSAAKALKRRH